MEAEWNGNVAAASAFCQNMRPWSGVLGITTWADPVQQDWLGVARAIAPCANLWIPQQYDNWLAAQAVPSEETIIQPGIDLSTEFGPNNVLALVKLIAGRHESAWFWEYVYAQENQNFVRTLTAILHGETLAELPGLVDIAQELTPPDPGYQFAYVTGPNDTSLADIAGHLGVSNWFEQLYKPNMVAIESAAAAAGHAAGSSGGLVIAAGVKLNYNL
jgi:hypothetical protein